MSPLKQQLLDAIEQAPEDLIERLLQDLLNANSPFQTLVKSGRIIAPSSPQAPTDETEFEIFTQSLPSTTLSDIIIHDREQW